MIGDNSDDYTNDDTIEIPLSCEDDEYREDYLREQEQEKNLFYRK